MTEVPNTPEETRSALAARLRDEILPFDSGLENLVMYINLLDTVEIGVTLHVKGLVVSGLLISTRTFFKLLVSSLDEAADEREDGPGSGVRAFADFYRSDLDTLDAAYADYATAGTLPLRPHHIHLRHVQTYSDASTPLFQQTWRGRLTQVDGWSIGNFGGPVPALEN